MTEKLKIKNFAGIKELEIEVKKINILIGPQASGKSVCAKLLYYFKNFVWEILSVVEKEETKRNLDANYSKTFKEYFPPDSWGNYDFFIRYEISDSFIEISRKKGEREIVLIDYSEFFKKNLLELRTLFKKLKVKYSSDNNDKYMSLDSLLLPRELLRDSFREDLITYLSQEAAFIQLFIPAGRSFFANLESNIFSFLFSNNELDPFLKAFGSIYENTKDFNLNRKDKPYENKYIQSEMNKLIERTLCGQHIREKGKDFLESSDGRRISVANSSSGQQETLPLTTILAALPSLFFGHTVYIEEPEAHLFPNAQRSIIELIATVFNYRKEKLQFFITTHSPYVLTSFNNLLQAGHLYEDSSLNMIPQLEKLVPKYKALNISEISAYVLENGKCKSIICNETGLIDANIIDSVSDDLAIQFDQLLNLV